MIQPLSVCYFGTYDPNFSRNSVYINGLQQNGVQVFICTSQAKGLHKYLELWRQHWRIRKQYDVMVVGYPGHRVVPFARLLCRKKLVFDALCSLYETGVVSRGMYKKGSLSRLYLDFLDILSYKLSHLILVESDQQKDFFIKHFNLSPQKCLTLYTGADDRVFHPLKKSAAKSKPFQVIFRGRFLPEAGVTQVVEAAKLLEKEQINVVIVGFGFEQDKVNQLISQLKPTNLTLISTYQTDEALRQLMNDSDVSLGQFGDNDRLKRTIPHKAYESIAQGIAYITAKTDGVAEILVDGETCLMTNLADSKDIVTKILQLKNNPRLRKSIADNGYKLYQEKFSPEKLGLQLKYYLQQQL